MPGPSFPELAEEGQRTLRNFLTTNLDTASTFLDIAISTDDEEDRQRCIPRARKALQTFFRFAERLQDLKTRRYLIGRADDLEAALERQSIKAGMVSRRPDQPYQQG